MGVSRGTVQRLVGGRPRRRRPQARATGPAAGGARRCRAPSPGRERVVIRWRPRLCVRDGERPPIGTHAAGLERAESDGNQWPGRTITIRPRRPLFPNLCGAGFSACRVGSRPSAVTIIRWHYPGEIRWRVLQRRRVPSARGPLPQRRQPERPRPSPAPELIAAELIPVRAGAALSPGRPWVLLRSQPSAFRCPLSLISRQPSTFRLPLATLRYSLSTLRYPLC